MGSSVLRAPSALFFAGNFPLEIGFWSAVSCRLALVESVRSVSLVSSFVRVLVRCAGTLGSLSTDVRVVCSFLLRVGGALVYLLGVPSLSCRASKR